MGTNKTTSERFTELPECPVCDLKTTNGGAASHGDGDIFDELHCEVHGVVWNWHARYCRCGCGGNRLFNVYDPDYVPIPWY